MGRKHNQAYKGEGRGGEDLSRDRTSYGLEASIRQEGDELLAFPRAASGGVAHETGCRLYRRGKTWFKQRHGEGRAVALFFEGVSVCVVWVYGTIDMPLAALV